MRRSVSSLHGTQTKVRVARVEEVSSFFFSRSFKVKLVLMNAFSSMLVCPALHSKGPYDIRRAFLLEKKGLFSFVFEKNLMLSRFVGVTSDESDIDQKGKNKEFS